MRDLRGKQFGEWLVLERAESNKHGRTMWLCRCNCGTEKIVNGASITRGLSKSCGCFKRRKMSMSRSRCYPDRDRNLRNIYFKKLSNLKTNYDLSEQEYRDLQDVHKGCCAICGTGRKLFVDHNHKTGKVRAMLCHSCNSMIGHSFESIRILKEGIKYMEQHK